MASTSEVKSGLNEVAQIIADQRAVLAKAQQNAANASAALAAISTDYSDVAATINAYGTTNAFEALSKAEFAKLQTEFTALKSAADSIVAVALD